MLNHESTWTNRVYVEIDIPDDIPILEVAKDDLPDHWDSKPPILETQYIGDDFVLENEAAILKVPSCIVPQEYNYLINLNHPQASRIKVISTYPLIFDSRLKKE